MTAERILTAATTPRRAIHVLVIGHLFFGESTHQDGGESWRSAVISQVLSCTSELPRLLTIKNLYVNKITSVRTAGPRTVSDRCLTVSPVLCDHKIDAPVQASITHIEVAFFLPAHLTDQRINNLQP